MKRLYVDIRNIDFGENIIDVCNGGDSAINKIISSKYSNIEKDISNLQQIDNKNIVYNSCVFFFVLSRGITKFKFNKIIKVITKVIDKDSKIYIWDVVERNKLVSKYELNVESDIGLIKLPIKVYFKPYSIKFLDIIKVLENNSFIIKNSLINQGILFVEAEFKGEETKVKNEGYISSIKCKICSFKFSNKVFKKRNRGL
ncbi:hypothetical protein [Caloramator proteoclasticus]|uniref:Uncharacterized protein n=1 Tax=Caloramator proteoclasticus DSM 10124 TaxID=1121262 RepID=A0A1M5C2W7_9CLOT|nr:hypothetical protein [Caloramator proteoclasticus]SHF49031.1 hypothetical protein SAMN02746091_02636 [Caloramator proteoclasticus DSM 10124]